MFGIPVRFLVTGGIVLAVLAVLAYAFKQGVDHADAKNDAERKVEIAEALKADDIADTQADTQRALDTAATTEMREELIDAVQQAPETLPAPAAVALGCQRLLNDGHRLADLPAVCRPDSAPKTATIH